MSGQRPTLWADGRAYGMNATVTNPGYVPPTDDPVADAGERLRRGGLSSAPKVGVGASESEVSSR
jgi:hypothetical protein